VVPAGRRCRGLLAGPPAPNKTAIIRTRRPSCCSPRRGHRCPKITVINPQGVRRPPTASWVPRTWEATFNPPGGPRRYPVMGRLRCGRFRLRPRQIKELPRRPRDSRRACGRLQATAGATRTRWSTAYRGAERGYVERGVIPTSPPAANRHAATALRNRKDLPNCRRKARRHTPISATRQRRHRGTAPSEEPRIQILKGRPTQASWLR